MALTITVLGTPVSTSAGVTSLAYGSVTPTGNEAVIVGSTASGVAGATSPSLDAPTWLSGSWETFEFPNTLNEVEAYVGATVASPSADNFTEDFDGDQLTGVALIAAEILGADTTDLVVQSRTDLEGTATSVSASLSSALSHADNAVVAILSIGADETVSVSDGETIVAQVGYVSPTRRLVVAYKVGVNDVQLAWTSSVIYNLILLEIKAEVTGDQTLAIGTRAAATTVRGVTLTPAGAAPLPLGRRAAATTVRGVTVTGSGDVGLAIGRRASSTTVRGLTVAPSGAAPVPIGRRAAATTVRGLTLTGSGTATLTIGKRASSTTVRGVTVSPSGAAPIVIGRRSSSTVVRGVTVTGTGTATPIVLGRRAAASTVRGVVLGGEALTVPIGRVSSSTTVRGVTLAGTGDASITIGRRAAASTVRGLTVLATGTATISIGRRSSSSTVRGVTLTGAGTVTIAIGRVAIATTVRGLTLTVADAELETRSYVSGPIELETTARVA